MNWLLILVIAILALAAFDGYRKGILRVLFQIIQTVLIIIFVIWATPYVSDFISTHTGIEASIEDKCKDYMRSYVGERIEAKKAGTAESLDNAAAQVPVFVTEEMLAQIDGVIDAAGDSAADLIEQSGAYDEVAQKVAGLSMRAVTFIATFILAVIICSILSIFINIVEKIPVLHGTNKLFGLIAGLICGFVIVWIAFAIIDLTSVMPASRALSSYIYENSILRFIKQTNIIESILMHYL